MATATAVDLRTGSGRRPWVLSFSWLVVLGLFFFWSYGLSNSIASRRPNVPTLSLGWEKWVPFIPWTIVPYWTSDALYIASVLVCTTRRELNNQVKRLITVQVISIACFFAFPLRCIFERPATGGFFGWLFDILLGFDKPYNQAPSLHVSLAVVLWFRFKHHLTGFWRTAMGAWLVLVSLSTMTTHQHHFLDLPTGALAGLLTVALIPDSTISQRLRLTTFYLSGAVLAISIAIKWSGVTWLLAWPCASCLVVAVAYAANRPGLFRNPLVRAIAAPYTAAAWLNSRFWTRGLEPAHEIADGIWLGRAPFGATQFSSIVSLAPELNVRGRTVPVLDLVPPTDAQLQEAVSAIEAAQDQRPTLVCCALGFSRSASAVAAWLVSTGRARSTAEAIALIHRKRPQIVLPALKEESMRAGFDCKVTAAFLESGRTLANVANAGAIVAGISCWYGRTASGAALGLSLAAWLVETWFAVRVAIDRSLFRTLAEEPADGADWLDALLVDWKLVKTAQSRSMPDRIQGALGLWRRQSAALGLQLTALAAALVLRAMDL